MKLSVIIPVFNEEKSITTVITEVMKTSIPSVKKEIIVVDDGSTDNTKKSIESFIKEKNKKAENLALLKHDKNMGKGAAVVTGIKQATGDYIIIQDADLEYDPSFIPTLLEPIIAGKAKIVYGTRLNRLPNFLKDESRPLFLLHYFGNRFLSLIVSILYGDWITDMETCYKIFPKKAADALVLRSKRFDFEPEITAKLLKMGYKICEIPITTRPRDYTQGKKLNALKDGPIALWTLLKYRFSN